MGAGRIVAVGELLTKVFGKGAYARKVVTQTIGNKTLTKVFDANGAQVLERFKVIERSKVGNKNVITRTQASVSDCMDVLKGEKLVYDRVYNSSGKFLGSRNVQYTANAQKNENPLTLLDPKDRWVTKCANDGGPVVTTRISNGIRKGTWSYEGNAGQRHGFQATKSLGAPSGNYCDKGLPIPRPWDEYYTHYEQMLNAPLRDRIAKVRDFHVENYTNNSDVLGQFADIKNIKQYFNDVSFNYYTPRFKVDFGVIQPSKMTSKFGLENFV